MSPNQKRRPAVLLFNPFVYVAGTRALLWGLCAILLAGFIGSLSHTHFDGVIDMHSGAGAPVWFFLSEGFVDWLCLAVVLLAAGKIVSTTSFRVIDVLGTQALARWPAVIISLLALPPGFHRFSRYLVQHLSTPNAKPELNSRDALVFVAVTVGTFLVTCWIVYLMYKAFSVSCNARGGKAVVVFIAAMILAEILSKVAIYSLFRLA